MHRRRRWGALLALVLLALAIVAWLHHAPSLEPARAASPNADPELTATSSMAAVHGTPAAAAPVPSTGSPEKHAFEIAGVSVEKDEVCQGEPSRIRVTAHDRRGDDQARWLTPIIDGHVGWEIPFVSPPLQAGPRRIPVTLVDSQTGESVGSEVSVLVKDCVAQHPVFVDQQTVPPDPEYVAFLARVYDGPAWKARAEGTAKDGRPTRAPAASYRWTFGDGATITTSDASVRHRYPAEADRPDERATSYPVRVDALGADGTVMGTGYAAVLLPNRLRVLERDHHLLQLVTTQLPGPASEGDGARSVPVTLTNIDARETASLTGLTLRWKHCDGSEGADTERPVDGVFADSRIGPRQSIRGTLTVSSTDATGSCWVDAKVSGTSDPGGLDVAGFFTLDMGASEGQPVASATQDVLHRAIDLLGLERDRSGRIAVTDDQIRRLEDEGKIPRGVLRPDPWAGRDSMGQP